MSTPLSIEDYVARQPRIAWRRHLMRGLIRWLGFGVLARVRITGTEHIPVGGPTILMMNHISSLDPGLVMGAVNHRFVVPMTKIENTYHLAGAFVVWWWDSYTVNRGEVDRRALMNSIELLKSGHLILIAPEGTRHPEGLARPKDGMAYLATKADAVIVPAAISGAVGWKAKWKRLQRPDITVNFGPAFRFRTEGGRVSRDALAQMTEEAMYQLSAAVTDPALRGAYSDLSQATQEYIDFV